MFTKDSLMDQNTHGYHSSCHFLVTVFSSQFPVLDRNLTQHFCDTGGVFPIKPTRFQIFQRTFFREKGPRERELFVALSSSEQQVLENTWWISFLFLHQGFCKRIIFMYSIPCPLGYITEGEIKARHVSVFCSLFKSLKNMWESLCLLSVP